MSPEKKQERRTRGIAYRTTANGRGQRLFYGARKRAEQRGISFSISKEWAIERCEAGVCEVTGLPFVFTLGNGKHPHGPSIDRIDAKLGYVPGNVQMVSWCYNAAKGTGTDEEVLVMARALVEAKSVHA